MKMKKSFNIFLAFVIVFFTVPFGGLKVSADADHSIEDGTYEIDYTVTYEDPSFDVDGYFTKPAILKVENGSQYVQLEHTDSNFIVSLSLPEGKVAVIDEDEANLTRLVGFNVDGDLSEPVNIGLDMFYGKTHDVQIIFDVDSLKIKRSEERRVGKEYRYRCWRY